MTRYLIKRTHFSVNANTHDWANYAGKRGIILDPSNSALVAEFGYTGEKSALRGLSSWEATAEHMTSLGEKLILEVVTIEI